MVERTIQWEINNKRKSTRHTHDTERLTAYTNDRPPLPDAESVVAAAPAVAPAARADIVSGLYCARSDTADGGDAGPGVGAGDANGW